MRLAALAVAALAALAIVAGVLEGRGDAAPAPAVAFESPSGNIRCAIVQGSGRAHARCVTLSPRQGAQVVDGLAARRIAFAAAGRVPRGDRLAYGRTIASASSAGRASTGWPASTAAPGAASRSPARE